LAEIFNVLVGIAEKVIKIRGQRSSQGYSETRCTFAMEAYIWQCGIKAHLFAMYYHITVDLSFVIVPLPNIQFLYM